MLQPPGAYAHSTASTSCPPTPTSALSKRSSCSSKLSSPKRAHKRRRKMDPRVDGRNQFETQRHEEAAPGGGLLGGLSSLVNRFRLWGLGDSSETALQASSSTDNASDQSSSMARAVEPAPPPRRRPRPEAAEPDDVNVSFSRLTIDTRSPSGFKKAKSMYTDHVQLAAKTKSHLRMEQLRSEHVRNGTRGSDFTRSERSALESVSSPNSSLSLRTPEGPESDPFMSSESSYDPTSTQLGHHRSFADYQRSMDQVNEIFGPSTLIAPRGRRLASSANRDLLKAKRPQTSRQTGLEGALRNARIVEETERPSLPSLKSYNKLLAKDLQTSEDIDDLTRKRRRWPKVVPAEFEQIAKTAWRARSGDIVSEISGAEVAGKDIVLLKPREWLNDELITFYTVLVNTRSSEAVARKKAGKPISGDEDLLDVHVFNSFFYEKVNKSGHQSVKRWSKKFDLFAKDMVIMPINLGNSHWVSAAINLRKKRFEYFDSMGRINHGVLSKLREYLVAEHLDKKKKPLDVSDWPDWTNPRTPQQANGWDCGVFTCQFIECLSRKDGHFDFAQQNMEYMRKKMIAEIVKKELMPEEWL